MFSFKCFPVATIQKCVYYLLYTCIYKCINVYTCAIHAIWAIHYCDYSSLKSLSLWISPLFLLFFFFSKRWTQLAPHGSECAVAARILKGNIKSHTCIILGVCVHFKALFYCFHFNVDGHDVYFSFLFLSFFFLSGPFVLLVCKLNKANHCSCTLCSEYNCCLSVLKQKG